MCKEDVRIKRETKVNTVQHALSNGGLVEFLPANPDRCALVVAMSGGLIGGAGTVSTIFTGNTTTTPALGTLMPGVPSIVFTIEQIGILLTYPIWIWSNDSNQYSVTVTEVSFRKFLGDL